MKKIRILLFLSSVALILLRNSCSDENKNGFMSFANHCIVFLIMFSRHISSVLNWGCKKHFFMVTCLLASPPLSQNLLTVRMQKKDARKDSHLCHCSKLFYKLSLLEGKEGIIFKSHEVKRKQSSISKHNEKHP